MSGAITFDRHDAPVVGKRRLWKERADPESLIDTAVLALSGLLALPTLGVAVLLFIERPPLGLPPSRWVDAFTLAIIFSIGPYGFLHAWRTNRRRAMEARFPDLLRDLAAGRKAGLTLPRAMAVAARGNYGALNGEIRLMSAQMEWGVRFEEVLQQFADRVKAPLVTRAVAVITEATVLGGNVSDVLSGAAKDGREIKAQESDRAMSMLLYTLIIYIAFFVFLGVVAVLYASLIPALKDSAGTGESGFVGGGIDLDAYRTFYFLAANVQGIGNGMVAGVMGTGRAVSGFPHAFALAVVSFVTFAFIL